jgi:hypothetical protein
LPFKPEMAFSASSLFGISTKPKPRLFGKFRVLELPGLHHALRHAKTGTLDEIVPSWYMETALT